MTKPANYELVDGLGFRLHNRRFASQAIPREWEPALECGGGCVNRVRRETEQP